MKREELSRAQALAIMGGAALLLSMAMGMRQAWGLFQPHMIRDIGITAAEFSFAIAIQNIVWGVTQPFVGAFADRHGVRRVALVGVMIYGAGLLLSAFAQSALLFTLGAGFLVGLALSCTASNIAMNVTARTASPAMRSLAMGAVSALGSLGIAITSPLAQSLLGSGAWGGGLIYGAMGAYDRAWQAAVVIGIVAGLFQMTMNVRPSPRILAQGQAA